MRQSERYPYVLKDPGLGETSAAPYLPLVLRRQGKEVEVQGLLDTGASINVLPYEVGVELGAVWEEQSYRLMLSGNLAGFEARALLVRACVGGFAPVSLAFAWTQAAGISLLLGQVNFFQKFDVLFCRSRFFFQLAPAGSFLLDVS